MSKIKVAFYDTKPYDKKFFTEEKNDAIEIKFFRNHLSLDTAVMAKDFDTICVFVNDMIDRFTMELLKECGVKLIALRCAGFNNVDLKAADHCGIKVVRVPAYSPHGVAEHAVALMLSLNRKIHKAYSRTRDNNFAINGLLGFNMHGRTIGVIGTGKIGKTLVPIVKGLGMKVLLYDPYPDEGFAKENSCEYVSLDTLYQQSDIITLHCPLTKDNERMINEKSIATMKKGVMIINTGRGKLIDTKALISGLKNEKIGYAGLDVYEEEGDYFFEDNSDIIIQDDILERLLTFPNVLLTSHQAFFTEEALRNIAQTTLSNIKIFFEANKIKNEVVLN